MVLGPVDDLLKILVSCPGDLQPISFSHCADAAEVELYKPFPDKDSDILSLLLNSELVEARLVCPPGYTISRKIDTKRKDKWKEDRLSRCYAYERVAPSLICFPPFELNARRECEAHQLLPSLIGCSPWEVEHENGCSSLLKATVELDTCEGEAFGHEGGFACRTAHEVVVKLTDNPIEDCMTGLHKLPPLQFEDGSSEAELISATPLSIDSKSRTQKLICMFAIVRPLRSFCGEGSKRFEDIFSDPVMSEAFARSEWSFDLRLCVKELRRSRRLACPSLMSKVVYTKWGNLISPTGGGFTGHSALQPLKVRSQVDLSPTAKAVDVAGLGVMFVEPRANPRDNWIALCDEKVLSNPVGDCPRGYHFGLRRPICNAITLHSPPFIWCSAGFAPDYEDLLAQWEILLHSESKQDLIPRCRRVTRFRCHDGDTHIPSREICMRNFTPVPAARIASATELESALGPSVWELVERIPKDVYPFLQRILWAVPVHDQELSDAVGLPYPLQKTKAPL